MFLFVCGDLRRVPVDTLTNLGAFSYGSNGWNPLTMALKEIDEHHDGFSAIDILSSFYQTYDATDSIGYLPVHHHTYWSSIKTCYQPPWSGGKIVRSSDDFEHWTGPKSKNDCRMIYDNLKRVYFMLKSKGYRPSRYPDGWIRVMVLEKSQGDYRCLVVGGQNRAAVVSRLGYKFVWVRKQSKRAPFPDNMGPKIKLKESPFWEKVRSGEYTHEDAHKFFSCYFEFDGNHQAKQLGLAEHLDTQK